MLKRVGGEINPEGAVTTIGEAEFPVPFPPGLEFNSPVHGNWNIQKRYYSLQYASIIFSDVIWTGYTKNWKTVFRRLYLYVVLWTRSCRNMG